MPGRGGGNRPLVKAFGTGSDRPGAGAGEGCRGRSRATRRLLLDRRGPAGARAGDRAPECRWRNARADGFARTRRAAYFGSLFVLTVATVAAPLLFIAGSVHGLITGAAGISAALARERAGSAGRELFRDLGSCRRRSCRRCPSKKKAFPMIAARWWWCRCCSPLRKQSKTNSIASKFVISEIRMRICAFRS